MATDEEDGINQDEEDGKSENEKEVCLVAAPTSPRANSASNKHGGISACLIKGCASKALARGLCFNQEANGIHV